MAILWRFCAAAEGDARCSWARKMLAARWFRYGLSSDAKRRYFDMLNTPLPRHLTICLRMLRAPATDAAAVRRHLLLPISAEIFAAKALLRCAYAPRRQPRALLALSIYIGDAGTPRIIAAISRARRRHSR